MYVVVWVRQKCCRLGLLCRITTFHNREFFLTFVLSIQVFIEKQKGEILGLVIVESGWGSILPTVIIANMMHGGPAEKSGKLNIGDQIMSINGTSLVGLPLSTCQSIIKVQNMIFVFLKQDPDCLIYRSFLCLASSYCNMVTEYVRIGDNKSYW